ncbi:bacterial proteasome activator family protein [Arthrobacter sp. zg-Y1219]|uniref:bacterial proteasome activator family protein n=1 Tax=Arthrobacter sp. zg-Y1219 TaxID=3049067 RepID=UPI0024C342EE|nr:bacterial proteasome activator family protein [Arthrobacter sp. zg-Y1219]MDK1361444.1 bacterial proteasome activator family protein [Arthrobacter sp. zg-Y1219]
MTEENGSADRPDMAPAPGSADSSHAKNPAGTSVGRLDEAPTSNPPVVGRAAGNGSPDYSASGGSGGSGGPSGGGESDSPARSGENSPGPAKLRDLVDEPAKVMRIGTMIKQLLEEVRNAPLDDAARNRLAEIHARSVRELEDGLAPELVDELHRVNLPFLDDTVPTDAELRIAQAQIVGWLEGLFRGIQTAIAAQQTANQQMASRLQLRQLPPGTVLAPGIVIGENGEPRRADSSAQSRSGSAHPEPHAGPGQYL